MPFDPSMITTALDLPGHRVVRNCGIVRGIVVRSRLSSAPLVPACKPSAVKHHPLLRSLRKDPRRSIAVDDGTRGRAGRECRNCARYDANEIQQAVTEVLAYGTAVVVEKLQP